MLPVPPAMPTELAAEITGVAAIELKLIAELHEVYGVRPPGGLAQRSTAYLNSWSDERGVDVSKPSTLGSAMNSHMKRQLRQQIMKRMVRDLPNLMPFMVGAAVGAVMNRRDTRKLAARIRTRPAQEPGRLERPGRPPGPGTPAGRPRHGRDHQGDRARSARPRGKLRQRRALTRGRPYAAAAFAASSASISRSGSRVDRYRYGVGSCGSVTSTRTALGM